MPTAPAEAPTWLPDREAPKAPVAALTGLALLGGIGGWLIAAPFALGDQARAAAWTTPTRVDVAAGALLVVFALAGLLGYLGAAIGWTARYGQQVLITRR